MEEVIRNRFNCYNLSTDGDNSVVDWNRHRNSSEVIEVLPYSYILLNYLQYNDTHYQWCGPMLLILEYFAKFTSTR